MTAHVSFNHVFDPFHLHQNCQGYQEQDSPLTLREGLVEYAAAPGLVDEAESDADTVRDVRAHDAAHVVFGCDTSVRGEILLTRWSLLGATDWVPFYLKGLRHRETRGLVLEFFRKARPWTLLPALLESFRCVVRSLRMARRWPSEDYARHLDRPLAEIRREFNIRVLA